MAQTTPRYDYDPFTKRGKKNLPKPVRVTTDGFAKIKHARANAEAGFDWTAFKSTAAFQTLLTRHGLHPTDSYVRVKKSPDEEWYGYVWANENVLIVTGNNPLTGAYSEPEARRREWGYAAYIGIEGRREAVERLFDDIIKTAEQIKGRDATKRSFI